MPPAGFRGRDAFTYRASDANGTTGEVEAVILVVPVVVGPATTLDPLRLTLEEQVAAIYVAYLGRAADRAGFDFWLDMLDQASVSRTPAALLADLAGSFRSSEEATALYPLLADPCSGRRGNRRLRGPDLLESVRPAAGCSGPGLLGGQIRARLVRGEPVGPMPVDIIAGAQNTAAGQDITTLMSKVAVTLHYVEKQRSRGSKAGGSPTFALSRSPMAVATPAAPFRRPPFSVTVPAPNARGGHRSPAVLKVGEDHGFGPRSPSTDRGLTCWTTTTQRCRD